ncbi:MAG: Acg family FMN-binding oxidoreductase [Micromonosporaceae bacterium]
MTAQIARVKRSAARLAAPSRHVIVRMLRAAVAAPSMLNTQPWRFRYREADHTFELYADPSRALRHCDPQGRAVHIACGAALFNLRLAIAASGREPVVRLLPHPHEPLLLATVRIAGKYRQRSTERELYDTIGKRHSSRQPFTDRQVPPGVLAELVEAAALEGATLHILGPVAAARVLELTAEADRVQREQPGYRSELAQWVGGKREWDGVPDSATGPRVADGSLPLRDFSLGRPPDQVRYARFEAHPQLAVLSTRFSGAADWLRAGQALQRVLLLATARGLATGLLTQALETADAWLVRDPGSGIEHPQIVLRLGYESSKAKATPRRPISDVLDDRGDERWLRGDPAAGAAPATMEARDARSARP